MFERISYCKEDRSCNLIKNIAQSLIGTVFQLHTPFNRFPPTVYAHCKHFLHRLLACNHATMKEQGFLSFARSRVIIVRFYREKKIKCKKLANN